MPTAKENLKALFTNTRSRIIIIFTLIIILTMIIVGVVRFEMAAKAIQEASTASVITTPSGIQSIPGAVNQVEQYAALQEQQNVDIANQALKTGGSALPTIVQSQNFGAGVDAVGPTQGEGGLGFETLSREDEMGPQRSLWLQMLKDHQCSKSIIATVMSQGADLQDLKNVCSCSSLKTAGYSLNQLKQICSCNELRMAGENILQFKSAGYTAAELRECGYTACEERGAGFNALAMKNAGFTDGELKGAGFSPQEIAAASGLPDGMTAADVRRAGCDVKNLIQLKQAGVSAAAIRRINGCSADQLRAAGYGPQDLKNAGFSAADLLKAGLSPADLKKAGYSARDLMNAGLSGDDLAAAGYTPSEIKAAELALPPGMTVGDIKDAGCSVAALTRERLAGVQPALIAQQAHCTVDQLNAAGFSPTSLRDAGFSPAALATLNPNGIPSGLTEADVAKAGCDASALGKLRTEGVSAAAVSRINHCSLNQLKAAGFTAAALKAAGYGADDLLKAGFSPADLKQAGFKAGSLLKAGVTPADLAAAGYSPQQIQKAQQRASVIPLSDDDIKKLGCSPDALKQMLNKGIAISRIESIANCTPLQFMAAGVTAKKLANAGFTPAQLLAAGYTPQQLIQAGLSPAGVIQALRKQVNHCDVGELKAARALNVSASTIKQTLGCSAQALLAAGYTPTELHDAGFTAAELKNAGVGAAALKAAGYSAKDLANAGFNAAELKAAGFDANQLRDAGFSAGDLKQAGFSASELNKAGFSPKELKTAGFSAKDLLTAGLSPKDLKDAGFSATDLRGAGLSEQALLAAGISPEAAAVAALSGLDKPGAAPSNLANIPMPGDLGVNQNANVAAIHAAQQAQAQQMQEMMDRQKAQMADQKFQQKIQQRTAAMLSAANADLQAWKQVSTQQYIESSHSDKQTAHATSLADVSNDAQLSGDPSLSSALKKTSEMDIKTGDILFAVVDTAVNSDEPSPILATIVSGSLKGAKLIGSFNLPPHSDKMVISFNTLSIPGQPKTVPINAYAIDPETGRTALSSETNHHYLMRYGSLFASTFLEGFGNAFQSADTTITIGGTGGTTDTTVQNGVGRSLLENAVIGLATVGKSWGQYAQQNMARPTTVVVYSGTGIGILFTQDVQIS